MFVIVLGGYTSKLENKIFEKIDFLLLAAIFFFF